MKDNCYILGAGVTGLAAGIATKWPIFETADRAGGICASYYIRPGTTKRLACFPPDEEAYRFEVGGGHWIFGADSATKTVLNKFSRMKAYRRASSIFFPDRKTSVPYPIQNNLRFFSKKIIAKVLKEISGSGNQKNRTMKEWLVSNFGATLSSLFFYPFHDLYTAGLYDRIAPQDSFKSPVDMGLIKKGARTTNAPIGYNANFLYPCEGLDFLIRRMAKECRISYFKNVEGIDVEAREIYFSDKSTVKYKKLISTLSLDVMIGLTGLKPSVKADPHTSVLVMNIGAVKGKNCPKDHWLYVPETSSGFHRVGLYSNVDASFLPKTFRKSGTRVGMYIERSYKAGQRPSKRAVEQYVNCVIKELQSWEFIREVDVVDTTWVDVAYTWSWPQSQWKTEALRLLREKNIYQIGRYGAWKFQGIAESVQQGLAARAFVDC
ncbi:MAG: protoporphyrinogen oxidase-like protein [Candidatus Omnitrophota bacterium]